MTPTPTALGLVLCEQVIVDHHSRNPSLINVFTGMAVEGFPSDPQRLSLFASLTDSQGTGNLRVVVVRLDTDEEFYAQQHPIDFPNRNTVVNVNVRIRTLRFPTEGLYEFSLFLDEDLVAQRRLRVYEDPTLFA